MFWLLKRTSHWDSPLKYPHHGILQWNYRKMTISWSFSYNFFLKGTISWSFSYNFFVKGTISWSFSYNFFVKGTISWSFSYNFFVKGTISWSFSYNFFVKGSISGSFSYNFIVKLYLLLHISLITQSIHIDSKYSFIKWLHCIPVEFCVPQVFT